MANIAALKKLKKSIRAEPSALESELAQALFDLEVNHKNYKATLQNLYVNSAKEVDLPNGKKAVLVFFPLRFIRKFRKIQKQLVTELEKKFSGKTILLIGQRKIQRQGNSSRQVQRSRTMAAVHEAILDDLVFPADVVGKRLKYKADGSKQLKIFLDARDREKTESKIEAICYVYKKLTGRDVTIGYMSNPALQQIL